MAFARFDDDKRGEVIDDLIENLINIQRDMDSSFSDAAPQRIVVSVGRRRGFGGRFGGGRFGGRFGGGRFGGRFGGGFRRRGFF